MTSSGQGIPPSLSRNLSIVRNIKERSDEPLLSCCAGKIEDKVTFH